jgi:hypothetical protein
MNSQDYDPLRDQWDSMGADDFIVPDGVDWSIEGVDVKGDCVGDCSEAVNLGFYANESSSNLPGTLLCDRPRERDLTGSPDFVVELSSPCELGAGDYWVSVQSKMIVQTGQWFWNARTMASGNAGAAWRNPGDGFGTGCVNWGRRTECGSANSDPDNVFRLRGRVIACHVPRVVGLKLGKAKAKLRRAECGIGRVRRVRSRHVGRVIGQNPRAGLVRPKDTKVKLVVGRR